ncbi:MAG TPA: hypothetical protein VMR97_06660 [Acidimicrobiales bacterium]|nr:hypothetical protein [Acidimicrobiales bacterium]
MLAVVREALVEAEEREAFLAAWLWPGDVPPLLATTASPADKPTTAAARTTTATRRRRYERRAALLGTLDANFLRSLRLCVRPRPGPPIVDSTDLESHTPPRRL